MNKTLKKVISSVAALAMTAGVCVAPVSAAELTLSDVIKTAEYYQAIEELVALDIVNGYEDGTYQPENNIVRSEVTKLVVAAMGPAYTQAAEGAAGVDTEFTDVPGSYWASGFIATGVSNGFINGNGDGTFLPENNVTYAEIVKMLVAALGYGAIADRSGGYPNGYLSTGASIGVTTGVNVVGADTIVTRGQVAMLIDNAIKVPVVAVTSSQQNIDTGAYVAQTTIMDEIKDGDAKNYQTLLTKNHNAYVVKGRIMATKKSDGALEEDEVRYNVESAKNFDGLAYGSAYKKYNGDPLTGAEEFTMKYYSEFTDELMFAYSEAIVRKDDDGDYTILCLTPTGANKTDYEDALLYVQDQGDILINQSIEFYKDNETSKKTTYKLATDDTAINGLKAKLYVNGVEIKNFDQNDIDEYIGSNSTGTVTLVDATDTGRASTDGKIDYILVSYLADATVKSVSEGETYKIYLDNYNALKFGNMTQLKVDTTDKDKSAKYYLDGVEVDYTELTADDVVSIAFDVNAGFQDSDFYTVYISRDTVTGRVDGTETDNNDVTLYTINGQNYRNSTQGRAQVLEAGESYVLFLNVYGQFISYDEDSESKNIGIVTKAKVSDNDIRQVTIVTTAGKKVTYPVKDSNGQWSDFQRIAANVAVQDRIVEYTINKDGYLSTMKRASSYEVIDEEYKAASQKLGKTLADDAVVLDISNSTDFKTINDVNAKTIASLSDGGKYSGYLVDQSSNTSEYRLFVETEGGNKFDKDTSIAAVQKVGTAWDESESTTLTSITSCIDGLDGNSQDVEPVKVASDAILYQGIDGHGDDIRVDTHGRTPAEYIADTYKAGDVFVYKTNSDGFADEVHTIFNAIEASSFDSFVDGLVKDGDLADNTFTTAEWADPSVKQSDKVELIFGAITDTRGSTVYVEPIEDTIRGYGVSLEKVHDFKIDNEANVYVYDYSMNKNNRVSAATSSAIVAGNVGDEFTLGNSKYAYVYENGSELNVPNEINYIFAKLVDGDIVEALVIYGSNK